MKSFGSLILVFLFITEVAFGQLEIQPKYPQPGDNITLMYDATSSALSNSDELEIVLYAFEGDQPVAHLLPHKIKDGVLKATFSTNENTKLVSAVVRDANDSEILDANEGKGYQKLMCNGEKPVMGAYYEKAMLKYRWSRLVGIDRDVEKAVVLMEKEIEMHGPMEDSKNILYLGTLARSDEEKAMGLAKTSLANLESKKPKSEKDYQNMLTYLGMTKDKEAEEKLTKKVKKKFPNGDFVTSKMMRSFLDSKDWDEKLEIFNKVDGASVSEDNKSLYHYITSQVAQHYANEGNWDQFDHYASMIDDKMRLASMYNGLAWSMSGESIDSTADNPEKAMKLSKKSLKYVNAFYADSENKPSYYLEKDWMKNKKYSIGMYSDTYALNAYHAGDYQGALEYQQASCEANDFSDPEMNERYAIYYQHIKGPKATGELLENMIREGQASTKMKDQFKSIFMEHYTIADAFSKYMGELEKESLKKLEEEMLKEMIDLESPSFVLKNLDGEEVSLESMKGKVVVLDFWATWCGPCKASFPGMQQAVDKYKDDPNVEFLFVDTWENAENKEEVVSKFIEEKAYTFHVLMDNEDKVVSDYKVEGIPTKFIIDKNQRIRFKSIGFSGSAEKLVDELSLMINFLKKEDTKQKVSMH